MNLRVFFITIFSGFGLFLIAQEKSLLLNSPKFSYEGCGCEGEVDLVIYDGNTGGYKNTTQNYWGGGDEVKKVMFGGRDEFTDSD